jgi:D-arabinose 1-dehydrogenase-like Zn-dependent alcohol dehydrogenase
MIGRALGARVIAVDIIDNKLEFAQSLGAEACVNAAASEDVAGEIW